VTTPGSEKADAVPGGRGKGAQDWKERGAHFLGTRRPGRRAVCSRPFRASATSQSAVGEALTRMARRPLKQCLTVPMVCDIHFHAMRNSLSYGGPARKVLGARRRRVGGLARYLFSVAGTSRGDVRAVCSGATSSNASVARAFVPPATTRAGMAQRAIPTIPLNPYAARARRSGLGTGKSPEPADKHVRATAFSVAVPASVAPLSIVIARETREGTRIKPGGEEMGLGRSLALPGRPKVHATAPNWHLQHFLCRSST